MVQLVGVAVDRFVEVENGVLVAFSRPMSSCNR
jgi:hypothetical protein